MDFSSLVSRCECSTSLNLSFGWVCAPMAFEDKVSRESHKKQKCEKKVNLIKFKMEF